MNDKQKINELLKTHGEDSNRIAKLLIENASLREAAEHYFHCVSCAEDSLGSCAEGYEHAVKLGLYIPNEKAV